jgi:hypothetical protein
VFYFLFGGSGFVTVVFEIVGINAHNLKTAKQRAVRVMDN